MHQLFKLKSAYKRLLWILKTCQIISNKIISFLKRDSNSIHKEKYPSDKQDVVFIP